MCCQTNTYALVYTNSAIYYTQMMSTHTCTNCTYCFNTGKKHRSADFYVLLASRMVFMYCSVDYLLQELY